MCSDPGPPSLPQCRCSWSVLYCADRFPSSILILDGKSSWTRKKKNHHFKIWWKNWSMKKKPVWWWLKDWISLVNLLGLLILSKSCHLLFHISSPQWFTTEVIALCLFYNQMTSVEPTQKHIDSSSSNLIPQITKYHKNAPLWPLFKRRPWKVSW